MIVDDDFKVLNEIKSYLDEDDFEIVTASTSKQALELIEEQERKEKDIDLILIDTPLKPGSDKKGFFSMKLANRRYEETDNFLQKPFTREQLRDFIKTRIE